MRKTPPASLTSLTVLCGLLCTATPAEAQWSYVYPSYSQPSLAPTGVLLGFKPRLLSRELNGDSLAGAQLDGRSVASVSYASARFDGKAVRRIYLAASRLVVVDANGKVRRKSKHIAGVRFSATLDNGDTVELRVDARHKYKDKVHKHLVGYDVSYQAKTGWKPLCGAEADGTPRRAIALRGRWDLGQGTATGGDHVDDPKTFTFGCEDLVVGKCVLAGYEPWRRVLQCTAKPGGGKSCGLTTLRKHHQACTRLLRADYCGDGSSHTVNGLEIAMYDGLGVRLDSTAWSIEAVWDEHGARCVTGARHGALPTCAKSLVDASCGSTAAPGTRLVSELAPAN